jgi:hypothetical protein
MPKRGVWTADQDAVIHRMAAAGSTWEAIGEALGVSRNTVIERGRRINARKMRTPIAAAVPDSTVAPERLLREPYPAGHPATWDLLMPSVKYPFN